MPIPADIRDAVLDLIRTPTTDTSFDTALDLVYDRVLESISHETDWFGEIEEIDTVANTSIYSVSSRATRLIAVLHQGFHLQHVPSRTLDLLTEWETEPSSNPEDWIADKLPLALDNVANHAPEQIAIRPAPDTSVEKGLTLVEIARPLNDSVVLLYVKPFLIYRTAGELLLENRDEKDSPAAAWFLDLAEIFLSLIRRRVPA